MNEMQSSDVTITIKQDQLTDAMLVTLLAICAANGYQTYIRSGVGQDQLTVLAKGNLDSVLRFAEHYELTANYLLEHPDGGFYQYTLKDGKTENHVLVSAEAAVVALRNIKVKAAS